MRSNQGCVITAFLRLAIIFSAALVYLHGRASTSDEG